MGNEKVRMDTADQEDFRRFLDYLKRISQKYGPDVFADAFTELVDEGFRHVTGTPRELLCSFCGKRPSDVADRMIAGPGVAICISCIDRVYNVRMHEWPDHK